MHLTHGVVAADALPVAAQHSRLLVIMAKMFFRYKVAWGKCSALPETRFWNRGCPTTPNWRRPVKGACGAPDKRQSA
jgi:hypothetical protein